MINLKRYKFKNRQKSKNKKSVPLIFKFIKNILTYSKNKLKYLKNKLIYLKNKLIYFIKGAFLKIGISNKEDFRNKLFDFMLKISDSYK